MDLASISPECVLDQCHDCKVSGCACDCHAPDFCEFCGEEWDFCLQCGGCANCGTCDCDGDDSDEWGEEW